VILATHDLAQTLERVSRLLILAGAPATLCADLLVPVGGGTALYDRLVGDFAFLGAKVGRKSEDEQLLSVSLEGYPRDNKILGKGGA
jgi:fermentation-respiration switch protein FrsA (DUF1100 family)